ncbi:MAG TPA: UvrB/UvrC motif-containing protein [Pirellulaceae bacterium]|nr:UvrB/UvrC motif-containing protein [Pirellulaceae bacterium]
MARRENIDRILHDWPYDPESINVRIVKGDNGREVIQMRVDLGMLQLETSGRPDGTRPHGFESYYDYLVGEAVHLGDEFVMSEEQCSEADREFVQFYHRRNCWLRLRQFRFAAEDADHTLGMMDFCRDHSPDESWTVSHEQYRPYVLFQRTQAEALAELEEKGPHQAVAAIDRGLVRIKTIFTEHEAEEHFDEDEMVSRLRELRDSLRDQFDDEARLRQKLTDAVAAEQYELAARLRDELAKRTGPER